MTHFSLPGEMEERKNNNFEKFLKKKDQIQGRP
jgi:hypothetical protein